MRPTQRKRWRNRRSNGENKRFEGSRDHNPLKSFYESNGPDVKVRGPAAIVAEKYLQLARDAQASGDLIAAEGYLQHSEHYNRLIAAAREQYHLTSFLLCCLGDPPSPALAPQLVSFRRRLFLRVRTHVDIAATRLHFAHITL